MTLGRVPEHSFSRRYVSCRLRRGRERARAEVGESTYSSTLAACVAAGWSKGCIGDVHYPQVSLGTLHEQICCATAAQRGGSCSCVGATSPCYLGTSWTGSARSQRLLRFTWPHFGRRRPRGLGRPSDIKSRITYPNPYPKSRFVSYQAHIPHLQHAGQHVKR